MKKLVLASLLCVLGAWPRVASAGDGVVLRSAALPEAARSRLVTDVGKAKVEKPAAFARVAAIRARLPELDRTRRGKLAPVGALLRQIGPAAVLPMLEMIALDATPRGDLSDTAWLALRAGLIEAVGAHRDPRAAPVLVAILDGAETEYLVLRAAAEALGRLSDDAAAAKLVALSREAGPKQKAVLAGMGDCRRLSVARALAEALALHPDAEVAEIVARSLGRVGNAWAWRTPAVARFKKEEAATRAAAAAALVDAFVAYEGRVRQAASNALLVVDDPSTPALIAAARRSAPAAAAALDALSARFARNATR